MLVGWRFINNTTLNSNYHIDNPAQRALITSHSNIKDDCINIFVHRNNLIDNKGELAAGGYCYDTFLAVYILCVSPLILIGSMKWVLLWGFIIHLKRGLERSAPMVAIVQQPET